MLDLAIPRLLHQVFHRDAIFLLDQVGVEPLVVDFLLATMNDIHHTGIPKFDEENLVIAALQFILIDTMKKDSRLRSVGGTV